MNRYVMALVVIATMPVVSFASAAQSVPTPTSSSSERSASEAVIAASGAAAYAADPSDSDDLGSLQKAAELWKKRAEIAKYKADAKAAAARGDTSLTTPLPAFAQTGSLQGLPPMASPPAGIGASTGHPVLVRIGGADGHFDARLDVSGHTVDVSVGDSLDGGWTVASITASSVKLVRGRQVLLLKV
ncbi:Type IV pilus biogenesis [Caballeronia calidae]|uniref:Type IV pilus biogenesis n=1 Tax=Caballeronia calidae TaxID=1777139 RepID=A0A158EFX7_9BURK|nr:type IV pilus biogenesis protein PilP [Caballeronia calidae]SAL05775.1 Type IV pilus biogenesis [Caballeronia calidae]